MRPEPGVRQRGLVGRRLELADGEVLSKYILPFVDATWRVPFLVIDRMGGPPRVLAGTMSIDSGRTRTPAHFRDLRPVESVPRDDFASLVHFDPWWAFRGVSGVDRPWIEAIFATNIARSFTHAHRHLKVHDLRFSSDVSKLDAVIAKDDGFRVVDLHSADVDLLSLRKPPPTAMRPQVAARTPEGL